MLAMGQAHAIRHTVLVEGHSIRGVAREMKPSRNTVRKHLAQSAGRCIFADPGIQDIGNHRRELSSSRRVVDNFIMVGSTRPARIMKNLVSPETAALLAHPLSAW